MRNVETAEAVVETVEVCVRLAGQAAHAVVVRRRDVRGGERRGRDEDERGSAQRGSMVCHGLAPEESRDGRAASAVSDAAICTSAASLTGLTGAGPTLCERE